MTKKSTRITPAAQAAAGVDLATWRAKRAAGITRTLPSGLRVRLRPVKLVDLIMLGEIPQTLDALVKRASSEGFGVQDVQQFTPLINAVVKACVIEPPIADVADETHLALSELDFDDRLNVFLFANGTAEAVRPFPVQPTGTVEPAPAE
jgi:hypothetical protein